MGDILVYHLVSAGDNRSRAALRPIAREQIIYCKVACFVL